MSQASVRTADRAVMQTGTSLGVVRGCVIVELTPQEETDLRAAYAQPHGNVYLSDSGVVTFDPYVPNAPAPTDPQVALDRTTISTFMNAASGSATPTQRDDVLKALLRYLGRRWSDA